MTCPNCELMLEQCAQIALGQPFYPDTQTGKRQQWVKEQIAAKIRALAATPAEQSPSERDCPKCRGSGIVGAFHSVDCDMCGGTGVLKSTGLGKYFCNCCHCGKKFIGHKREVTCPDCKKPRDPGGSETARAKLQWAVEKAAETFEQWAPVMRALGRIHLAEACDISATAMRQAMADAKEGT